MTAVGKANVSVALSGDWLNNTTDTLTNASWSGGSGDSVSIGCVGWWPYQPTLYYPYYVPCYQPEKKPIKLAMSEVAKLRTAAQKDAKLKAILAKFTDLIEVTVEFE